MLHIYFLNRAMNGLSLVWFNIENCVKAFRCRISHDTLQHRSAQAREVLTHIRFDGHLQETLPI